MSLSRFLYLKLQLSSERQKINMSDRKKRKGKTDIRETARREVRALTKEELYKASATKYRSRGLHGMNLAVVLCATLAAAIIAASVLCILKIDRPQRTRRTDIEQSFTADSNAEEESAKEKLAFTYITKSAADVHSGYLILVNFENEYVPEAASEITDIYSGKTSSYSVAYNNYKLDSFVLERFNEFMDDLSGVTGDTCVLVNSSYRSVEEQTVLAKEYRNLYGDEYVEKYVATPGYSEHHTGMALDLTTRYSDGSTVPMRDYANLETLNKIGVDHGFVTRYPENKYSYTKINTEPWHYRYVGVPHATVMTENNLCLEEYVTYLKDYTADGEIMLTSEDGTLEKVSASELTGNTGYAVYYVSAMDESGVLAAQTKIPIPESCESYEISGNNSDGFIVTVKLKEAVS